MTRYLVSLLRRIVGRVKENMSALYLGIASICIPIAMYIGVEAQTSEGRIWALAMLLIGAISLIFALITAQRDRKIEDAKFWTQFKLTSDVSNALISEMKGLREDTKELIDEIRQERNERNDSDK